MTSSKFYSSKSLTTPFVNILHRYDKFLELNETYLLTLQLSDESIDAGARIGAINQTRVTIINDDSKILCRCVVMIVCTINIFQKFKFI